MIHFGRPLTRLDIGRLGEAITARHLSEHGHIILARNWFARGEIRGELDIVSTTQGVLHVTEVKTRTSHHYGTPPEAVTPRKLDSLARLTTSWLRSQNESFSDIAIDVASVDVRIAAPSHIASARVLMLEGVTSWR